MIDETNRQGINNKNSIDEFVGHALTATGDVVQDVRDYAGKTTKPIVDFVSEVRESETYARAKEIAGEIAVGTADAVKTYAPIVIPAAVIIGTRVVYTAKGIAGDISDLLPNRATGDAARLGLKGFDATGYLTEYDAAKGFMDAGDKEQANLHLESAKSMISGYRHEFMHGKKHDYEQIRHVHNLERSINRLRAQING